MWQLYAINFSWDVYSNTDLLQVCSDFIHITDIKKSHTIIVRIMAAGGDSLWPGNLLSL